MGKFINPFTDFGFHRIFGQEVHKELLIDFLNQLFFGENRTSARMILNVGFIIEAYGHFRENAVQGEKGGLR